MASFWWKVRGKEVEVRVGKAAVVRCVREVRAQRVQQQRVRLRGASEVCMYMWEGDNKC